MLEDIKEKLKDFFNNWELDCSNTKPYNAEDFAKGLAESYTKEARERYGKDDIVVKTKVENDNKISMAIENPPLEMLVDMAEVGIDFDMPESKIVRQDFYIDSDIQAKDLGF